MPTRFLLVMGGCLCSGLIGCRTASHTERGAGLGAVSGALIGAAIGDHNGKAGAGAAIGAAVGGLAGAAVGDSMDRDAARAELAIQQRMGRRMAGAVTVGDVVAMSQAGLSEEVIATHIRIKGVAHPVGVHELVALREQGVSDLVIQTMQQAPDAQSIAEPTPPPVIVEDHFYAPPPPVHFHYGHRPRRVIRRPRPRSGFSFSFHN